MSLSQYESIEAGIAAGSKYVVEVTLRDKKTSVEKVQELFWNHTAVLSQTGVYAFVDVVDRNIARDNLFYQLLVRGGIWDSDLVSDLYSNDYIKTGGSDEEALRSLIDEKSETKLVDVVKLVRNVAGPGLSLIHI